MKSQNEIIQLKLSNRVSAEVPWKAALVEGKALMFSVLMRNSIEPLQKGNTKEVLFQYLYHRLLWNSNWGNDGFLAGYILICLWNVCTASPYARDESLNALGRIFVEHHKNNDSRCISCCKWLITSFSKHINWGAYGYQKIVCVEQKYGNPSMKLM